MAEETIHKGDIILDWEFPEYVPHERGRLWYALVIIILIGTIGASVLLRNYTAIPVAVLVGLILFIRVRRQPMNIHFVLREEGVEIGPRFHPWSEFSDFFIVYRPPAVKKVYFSFKSQLRPVLDIPLQNINPIIVRRHLAEVLPENTEREEEPTSDQLSRTLKI